MADTTTILQTPQLSQLSVNFRAPLWADMQVATVDDLQYVGYLYVNKLVWVNDEHSWYYYVETINNTAEDGSITQSTRWEKQDKANITEYITGAHYLEGECVFLDSKIYMAQYEINNGETPLDPVDAGTVAPWLCISGNTVTKTSIFTNMSICSISTTIENPIFNVYLTDDNGETYYLIESSFEKISDSEYLFEFYESGELVEKSGKIIYK